MSRTKSIADLLSQGELGRLAAEARARREMTDRIRRQLPPDEARELVAAHREPDGTLTLLASSAAWATRLRYRATELDVPRVKVRVAPRGST